MNSYMRNLGKCIYSSYWEFTAWIKLKKWLDRLLSNKLLIELGMPQENMKLNNLNIHCIHDKYKVSFLSCYARVWETQGICTLLHHKSSSIHKLLTMLKTFAEMEFINKGMHWITNDEPNFFVCMALYKCQLRNYALYILYDAIADSKY